MKLLAVPLAVLAFHGSVQPLRPPLRTQIAEHRWHRGCPVPLSRLRVVTVDYWGFDGRVHRGELIVHRDHARLYVKAVHEGQGDIALSPEEQQAVDAALASPARAA